MKKIIVLILVLLITGCSTNSFEVGYSSNLLNEEDQDKLKIILKDNKLSNVDIFISWIKDYNKDKDQKCGMNNWNKTLNFKYNDLNCINRYEKTHNTSDGNCRLISYTLLQDKISFKNLKKEHGTYLMFDIDVLDNNDEYKFIKDNFNELITLFDEIKVENEKVDQAFINNWDKYGISIENNNTSLISFVIHDKENNIVFVGHTGVLIKLNNKYLFIEKIAFELPYQVNVLKTKKDLVSLFKSRDNYFTGEDEEGPFIYENNKLIYSY